MPCAGKAHGTPLDYWFRADIYARIKIHFDCGYAHHV
jgi:hypothetical protein